LSVDLGQISAGYDDIGARPGKRLGDRCAQTARGASDQGDPILE